MSSSQVIFQRIHGKTVKAVLIEVLFYGDEAEGTAGDVAIDLADGFRFFFGCAGDGSIFVRRSGKAPMGAPPNITAVEKHISGLVGKIRDVNVSGNTLRLGIETRTLQLTNDDDEMVVSVDGTTLPREIFIR